MPAYTRMDFAARHELRLFDRALDGLDGGSMFTTTPFFKPRDGWLPMPMISIAPSALISPTMATTLAGADVQAHQ